MVVADQPLEPFRFVVAAVQRRREWPVWLIQKLQGFMQRNVVASALDRGRPFRLPWPAWLMFHTPLLRDLPARVLGFGFGRERIARAWPGA